jgi:outer membrane receptor protein involved in Fe transport
MDILPPFSMFGDRFRQLDFRATKTVRMGSRRIQLNLDVYNLLNASAATFIQNTYSAPGAVTATPWLSPTQVQDGRFAKVSAQLFF